MRNSLALILTLCFLSFSFTAEAKTSTKTSHNKKHSKKSSKKSTVTKKVTTGDEKGQIGTSFSFDAASVRGKYQMAGQGLALVEDEKVIDDLLGLRMQFKDREQQESSRW